MAEARILHADRCMLLVVDVQEAFVPVMPAIEGVIERGRVMVEAAHLLGLPIVVSEQYPKGLGATVGPLRAVLGEAKFVEKTHFNCWAEPAVAAAIKATGRDEALIVGIEAHICVCQTALALLAEGYVVHVAADAVGSRCGADRDTALARLRQAGAVVTSTEAAIMEMTVASGHPQFKQISRVIK